MTVPVAFAAGSGRLLPIADGQAAAAWPQPLLLPTIVRQSGTPAETFGPTAYTALAATVARTPDERTPDERISAAAAQDPAVLNTASDIIDDVYAFTRYWANYVSLELGPWLINWIPFGYLISDQILIWYPNFVLPVVDSFVYDFLDPVVNDPLNLAVWAEGISTIVDTAVTGVRNGITAEIQYILDFGWFPFPLPPLPSFPLPATSLAGEEAAEAAVERATVDSDASAAESDVASPADDVRSDDGSATPADGLTHEESPGSADDADETDETAPDPVDDVSGDVVDGTVVDEGDEGYEGDADVVEEAVEADVTTDADTGADAAADGDHVEPASGDAPADSDGGTAASGSETD
ncbi:hypothetical protein [Mycolicibacterium aurum]|nr:hypothetical protein [Mycolicibacterium aurum]